MLLSSPNRPGKRGKSIDEATSNLDHATAEQFAKTINALKGHVTMLFITHQVPKGLRLDEVVQIGSPNGEDKHFGIVNAEVSA